MTFDEKVWKLCKKIPKGRVTTYKAIAEALGTKAYRAVGQALKKNKYPEIIPCFRVVKSDGSIGGYSGSDTGNIKNKIKKLKSDGIIIRNNKIDVPTYIYKFNK